MSDVEKSFGTVLRDNKNVEAQASVFKAVKKDEAKKMPDVFNPFERWGFFLSRIKTQGKCGCCWAMSASKTLGDRYSILSGGKLTVELSPYQMVMCEGAIFPKLPDDEKSLSNINLEAHTQGACNGNTLFTAMNFMYSVGLTDTTCVNRGKFEEYGIKDLDTLENPEDVPMCQSILGVNYDRCLDQTRAPRFYRTIAGYQINKDIDSIKQEIYKWGPVSAGFQVYDDFLETYDGTTIYMGPESKSKNQGGHAIQIIGWGKEDGVDFWWIANSWGTDWGLGGYFRMKMNIEKCQLEQNVVGFIPDFPTFQPEMLQYKLTKNAEMEELREWIGIDRITGYKFTTIRDIEEGKVKGNLKPLMTSSKLPDMVNAWLGEIDIEQSEVMYDVSHYHKKKDTVVPTGEMLFIIGGLALCFYAGKWYYGYGLKK
jgi:cathepsin B